jgi:hypothetical protein
MCIYTLSLIQIVDAVLDADSIMRRERHYFHQLERQSLSNRFVDNVSDVNNGMFPPHLYFRQFQLLTSCRMR